MSCVSPASTELKTLAAIKFPGFEEEEEMCRIDAYSESECDLEDTERGIYMYVGRYIRRIGSYVRCTGSLQTSDDHGSCSVCIYRDL